MHEQLSLYWDAPRVAAVGEVMIYSNHNYHLLGEIVQRLSGRGLAEQARQRIFDPLGMRDSYYVVPESEVTRVVQRGPGIAFGPDFPPLPDIGGREWRERQHRQTTLRRPRRPVVLRLCYSLTHG